MVLCLFHPWLLSLCRSLISSNKWDGEKGRRWAAMALNLSVVIWIKVTCLRVSFVDQQCSLPGGAAVKNPPANAQRHKRHRFDPWVRKIPYRRKWQPVPVFSPGKFHGQRSLAGLQRIGHDWARREQDSKVVISMGSSLAWLNGHEFEQALGDAERQGSLACCRPWGCKELGWVTEKLAYVTYHMALSKCQSR